MKMDNGKVWSNFEANEKTQTSLHATTQSWQPECLKQSHCH